MREKSASRGASWWLPCAAAALVLAVPGCAGKAMKDPQPGPRYLCFMDPRTGLTPECELESVFQPGPAEGPMEIWEVTRYPGLQPTPEQQKAADELVERCYESARRNGWYDYDKGMADGYAIKASGDPVHYTKREFLLDDHILDPDRPEVLMYYNTPKGKRLVGFMFLARDLTAEGPQIGGNLTRWHYHTWSGRLCFEDGTIIDAGVAEDGVCPEGSSPSFRSPEMMHVWLLEHPLGRFAGKMHIDADVLEELLEKEGNY